MTTLSREDKKKAMKEIILGLHRGLSAEDAKERFEQEVGDVTSTEIADIEQGLINEGLAPEDIKKFCNVHALIFQSALEKAPAKETSPAHPVYLFKLENREVEKVVEKVKGAADKMAGSIAGGKPGLKAALLELKKVETHYERKEQLLFPYLEKQGFMGPSKVMWGKDNEVRELMRSALNKLDGIKDAAGLAAYRKEVLDVLLEEVPGMIFKEENILFPASLEKLEAADWVEILRESEDIGYVFIRKPEETDVLVRHLQASLCEETTFRDGAVTLPTGNLGLEELAPLFGALPLDITFVGKDDAVRFFSDSRERIFSRPRSVIGRRVQNCHPPQSLDKVEEIITSFKEGKRDSCDFWINRKGRLIYIKFLAVRDGDKNYLGTLEVTQDVTDFKTLKGEKRLLDEGD